MVAEKLILDCPYHEHPEHSLIVDQKDKSFHCIGCDKVGLIKDDPKIGILILRYVLGNDNVFFGTFREIIVERCSDAYPLQIVLNSGVIIEVDEMTELQFYEDHIQIYDNTHSTTKVIYPHDGSDFSFRHIWIPYSSISFVTDAAS